jgi:hypothetical protein
MGQLVRSVKRLNYRIHREALIVKQMLSEVKDVLDSAVKSANFTEAMPMNVRFFFVYSPKNMGISHFTGSSS